MAVETLRKGSLDPPNSVGLRAAFLVLWAIDAIAATLFFLVPYATELNPITVLFYQLFGLTGVPVAALCYAAAVVMIGHVLSDPMDVRFIGVVVVLYTLFAVNNILLLLFREPVVEMLFL